VTAWGIDLKDHRTSDYDKRCPLHLAAAEGCYSATAWLLAQGVAVNPIDRFKRTPLEDAVRGDHGEVATLLIQSGAKVVGKEGELVELQDSPLAGNVRIFSDYDPEWEIDPSQLVMMEKVGEGEFGIVHKAKWAGTVVAVKILKETGDVAIGDFRTELNVLQKVHHPHTVQFLGAVTKTQPYMIITEYMTGASLSDWFKGQRFPGMWRAVQVAMDCARGLAYLHSRQPTAVIHRDLKPANLMMGGPKIFNNYHRSLVQTEMGVLKIADFGLSKSLKMPKPKRHNRNGSATDNSAIQGMQFNPDGQTEETELTETGVAKKPAYKLTGETGSYRYMAPEVFRHELYNNKVDVYSWAMIAYQLFEGLPPFWSMDPVEAARAAALEHLRPQWGRLNRHEQVVPAQLKELVERCWSPDYGQRPEFEEIVELLEEACSSIPAVLTTEPKASSDACCCVQ